MATTHHATVNIKTSGTDSNVTPNPITVNDGDTVIWTPSGGTINSFSFSNTSVFSTQPHQATGSSNWEAVIKTDAPTTIDTYTVTVTSDSGATFVIDPELDIDQ